MKTVDLGWCWLELTTGGNVVRHFGDAWTVVAHSPAKAIQLADALKMLAESYVDPVEAKARELRDVMFGEGTASAVPSGAYFWMVLARHVLEGEKRAQSECASNVKVCGDVPLYARTEKAKK